jgi:phosphoribosylanthranilate isomerase
MTRIKMCGFTRATDARAAVEAGADAIGLVFWPGSPRFVSLGQAAAIVDVLPPFVMPVGVFVDQSVQEIRAICRQVPLGAIQLHGHEPGAWWTAFECPVIKSVAVGPRFEASVLATWPPLIVPLLDVADPVKHGGTGCIVDWTVAAAAARQRPVVLAGGLSPANAAEAVTRVRPAAVDVSSGIEDEPGIKNADRMVAFVRAVRVGDEAVSHDQRT